MSSIDQMYMREALKEAQRAFDAEEVPVGAVIVSGGRIVARAHNQIRMLKDPTAHAEMIAITQAAAYFGSERLPDAAMYVTIEPCTMCAGALVLARMKQLVFGAWDPKAGAFGSKLNVNEGRLNHRISVMPGVLEAESAALLKDFFRAKRTA